MAIQIFWRLCPMAPHVHVLLADGFRDNRIFRVIPEIDINSLAGRDVPSQCPEDARESRFRDECLTERVFD
ncbi:MAG: hypothetical protein P8Y63_09770 [Deltaproteobacteria bacterium]|jgi:hypothetical protein